MLAAPRGACLLARVLTPYRLEAEHELLLVEYEVLGAPACSGFRSSLRRPPPQRPTRLLGAVSYPPKQEERLCRSDAIRRLPKVGDSLLLTIQVSDRTMNSPTRAMTPARAESTLAPHVYIQFI